MAVEPLYNADMDTLLGKVRIDMAGDDTMKAVHQAVVDVRIGFFTQLGDTRALELAALPTIENPTTKDGLLKARAISAEVIWLSIMLAPILPMIYMDNAASTGDKFNDEPFTRDASALQEFLDEMNERLADLLTELASEDKPIDYDDKVSLNGPDEPYLISENQTGNPCGC